MSYCGLFFSLRLKASMRKDRSNEITSVTHGTFIEGFFHIDVFTPSSQSMLSSETRRHRYVDALSLWGAETATSISQNLTSHSEGGRGTRSLEVKPPRQPVQPFPEIAPPELPPPKNPRVSADFSPDI